TPGTLNSVPNAQQTQTSFSKTAGLCPFFVPSVWRMSLRSSTERSRNRCLLFAGVFIFMECICHPSRHCPFGFAQKLKLFWRKLLLNLCDNRRSYILFSHVPQCGECDSCRSCSQCKLSGRNMSQLHL